MNSVFVMRQIDRGQHAGMHRQDSFAMQDENEEDGESQHLSGKSESEEEEYESFCKFEFSKLHS